MNNIIKAKIIVELLDERKYSILSSFSSSELNKLNSVSIDDLNQLSASDINNTVNDFLKKTEEKMNESNFDNVIDPPVKEVPKMKPKKASKAKKASSGMSEKLNEQPPQLIACLLNKVNEEQKELILANLSKDQKDLIQTIQVDDNPIFEKVVGSILEELDLTPA